jgi:hypothetical protein
MSPQALLGATVVHEAASGLLVTAPVEPSEASVPPSVCGGALTVTLSSDVSGSVGATVFFGSMVADGSSSECHPFAQAAAAVRRVMSEIAVSGCEAFIAALACRHPDRFAANESGTLDARETCSSATKHERRAMSTPISTVFDSSVVASCARSR